MLSRSLHQFIHDDYQTTHIKVCFNKTQIAEYMQNDTLYLKDIIPKLKSNHLYSLNLFYKENGMYYPTELNRCFVFIDDKNKLILCSQKNKRSNKLKQYVKLTPDHYFTSRSTKKLIVEESKLNIVDLHIYNDPIEDQSEYKIDKHVFIVCDQLNIYEEMSKILKSYEFEFTHEGFEFFGKCMMDEMTGKLLEMDRTNTVCVKVKIIRKKGFWERIGTYFKEK
jgi:hypothetical protein